MAREYRVCHVTVVIVRTSNVHYTCKAIVVGGPFVLFVIRHRYQIRSLRRLSLFSRKDGLTGLNNRRTFMELAQKRLESSRTWRFGSLGC